MILQSPTVLSASGIRMTTAQTAPASPVGKTTYYVPRYIRNPISGHGDRELPDISAPGSEIPVWYVPGAGGTTGPRTETTASGSSLSSPVVTSVIGFMAQEDSTFSTWPELSKAAVIATAWQNVEGPVNSIAS